MTNPLSSGSPSPDGTTRPRRGVGWAGLPAALAVIVGAVASVAQVLEYLGRAATLLIVAAGIVLAVAPIGVLVRRGGRAVPGGVAVLLCLLVILGGAVAGYGVRGGFVPGTPWAPGVTGEAGPRIPGTPPATSTGPAPVEVALTDPNRRSQLIADHNEYLDVATTQRTIAGRGLTDAFMTYCACAPTQVQEGRLSVALGGEYRTFTALLGVDQASRGTGQLTMSMRDVATGRTLFQQDVGFAAAVPVRVDVTGIQRAEFVVRGTLGDLTGVIGEPRVTS